MTATKSYKKTGRTRTTGSTRDIGLTYAIKVNPGLKAWQELGVDWLKTLNSAKSLAMNVIKKFLVDYIHHQNLALDPAKFLRAGYKAPCFYETCLSHLSNSQDAARNLSMLRRFIAYVLETHFSVEDDIGRHVIPPEFCSPILSVPAIEGVSNKAGESNKNVLPYTFIRELREIICPTSAKHFSDWKWAQNVNTGTKGGDWFEVTKDLIDETDPDCVWRTREKFPNGSRKRKPRTIYELWFPGRALALYIKLELPLRTYQVRILDSGEADTWIYQDTKWVINTTKLAKGTERTPYRRGFLRKMVDLFKQLEMTGLFINTNKTADIDKEEWDKGYSIPWQHEIVIYWAERMRNWQAKYNPIERPTPWATLNALHFGVVKPESTLKAMGEACFLFRDARAKNEDRTKPIHEGIMNNLWHKLLLSLERKCANEKRTSIGGAPLRFVTGDGQTTYYPLHALRVSLITAFALEGGVSMQVLSKCIAGHCRLGMSMYYTKTGVSHVTEKMAEADKKMLESERDSYIRWLSDATYKELENNGAFSDPAAIQAVLLAQSSGAGFVKDCKGICPKGALACDSGGVYENDDTGVKSYGPVPGYPEKNCPRCRWFFTGPAFLDGLLTHWNIVHLQMGDNGEHALSLEDQIADLEDEEFLAQSSDIPFLHMNELNSARKAYQTAIERNNKLGWDSTFTLRLIARCQALSRTDGPAGEGVTLVGAGCLADVQIAIEECSKLQQVLTAIEGSTVYPEYDFSKVALQAGRAYDMMLAQNRKPAVFFRLEEHDLLNTVRHMTNLLKAEAGSIKGALPFVEGTRKLEELGIISDIDQFLAHSYEELGASYTLQKGARKQVSGLELRT